ncbi:MAG: hypothetical protein M3401_18495 [Actinomycetota bacterium]|nr:hypothetical protein [Actinomycetota bacterium]
MRIWTGTTSSTRTTVRVSGESGARASLRASTRPRVDAVLAPTGDLGAAWAASAIWEPEVRCARSADRERLPDRAIELPEALGVLVDA